MLYRLLKTKRELEKLDSNMMAEQMQDGIDEVIEDEK